MHEAPSRTETHEVIDLTEEGLAKPDRRTLNILPAALDLEQRQLTDLMGYEPGL